MLAGDEWAQRTEQVDRAAEQVELAAELTERVQRLLRDDVQEYEQLEVLLLLFRHRDRDWSPKDIGERLSLTEPAVTDAIGHLRSHRLLQPGRHETSRYAPDPETDECVADLARAYDMDRFSVIQTMSANALDRLRTSAINAFADAFRLRRRDSDG